MAKATTATTTTTTASKANTAATAAQAAATTAAAQAAAAAALAATTAATTAAYQVPTPAQVQAHHASANAQATLLRALVGGGYLPMHAVVVPGSAVPTTRGTVRPVHQGTVVLALAALGGKATVQALTAYVRANAPALAKAVGGQHATVANVLGAVGAGNLRCTWAFGVLALAPVQ